MIHTLELERRGIRLETVIVEMGSDLLVSVMGGDKPHIGCASVSVPRPSWSDSNMISATTSTINLLGHKDNVIADMLSATLSSDLNIPVVVVCGVHIEKATHQDLETVQELTDELLSKIQSIMIERRV